MNIVDTFSLSHLPTEHHHWASPCNSPCGMWIKENLKKRKVNIFLFNVVFKNSDKTFPDFLKKVIQFF